MAALLKQATNGSKMVCAKEEILFAGDQRVILGSLQEQADAVVLEVVLIRDRSVLNSFCGILADEPGPIGWCEIIPRPDNDDIFPACEILECARNVYGASVRLRQIDIWRSAVRLVGCRSWTRTLVRIGICSAHVAKQ